MKVLNKKKSGWREMIRERGNLWQEVKSTEEKFLFHSFNRKIL